MNRQRGPILVILAAFAISMATASMALAEAKGIAWNYDFAKPAKEAQKAKKPLMVDFFADWCTWCKKLDRDTYMDARVVELSKRFVCVKVDTDKFPDLASQYKVDGLPTIVFLDSKTKETNRVVGYKNADGLLAAMKVALKKAK